MPTLAIGSNEALRQRLEAAGVEDTAKLAGQVLRYVARGPSYRQAVASDLAWRHDLDGNPVEPVSDEHRQMAVMWEHGAAMKALANAQKPQAQRPPTPKVGARTLETLTLKQPRLSAGAAR